MSRRSSGWPRGEGACGLPNRGTLNSSAPRPERQPSQDDHVLRWPLVRFPLLRLLRRLLHGTPGRRERQYNLVMRRKRPSQKQPAEEQLVFPFQLRVGDVILEDGDRFEIVGRPTGASSGKMTRARVRRQGEEIQHEAMWEAWRKLRVIRAA